MQYVLASASPRRKELFAELVNNFEIQPSDFDESAASSRLTPSRQVKALAEGKAKAVALQAENEGKIVLGSDTVVAYKKDVLGKPKDEMDAAGMLRVLSNKKHYVYTGVCLMVVKNGEIIKKVSAVEKTAVYFEKLSIEQIEKYVATGSPMDKAGGYGIQDGGLVRKIRGSYSNVVGLPIELVKKLLKKIEK